MLPITLFLDFDGVLTPLPKRVRGEFAWFARLPVFEAAVRPCLHYVEIVLSTDWRHKQSLEVLQKRFSPDVAARIKGMTGAQRPRREMEIVEWLAVNPRAHWFAIDDRREHFAAHPHRLIAVDRTLGFTVDDGQRLLDKVMEAYKG